MPCLS